MSQSLNIRFYPSSKAMNVGKYCIITTTVSQKEYEYRNELQYSILFILFRIIQIRGIQYSPYTVNCNHSFLTYLHYFKHVTIVEKVCKVSCNKLLTLNCYELPKKSTRYSCTNLQVSCNGSIVY